MFQVINLSHETKTRPIRTIPHIVLFTPFETNYAKKTISPAVIPGMALGGRNRTGQRTRSKKFGTLCIGDMTATHWKKMTNPDYFGSHDLMQPDGKYGEITVTLATVTQEKVKGADGKDSLCIVAKTAETKPIILNRTNCKTITRVLGTPIIEKWAGQRIIIGVEPVKAFGETTDALRVRKNKPGAVKQVDYTAEIQQIAECTTLEQLGTLWMAFPGETKTALLSYKDKRKTELTQ